MYEPCFWLILLRAVHSTLPPHQKSSNWLSKFGVKNDKIEIHRNFGLIFMVRIVFCPDLNGICFQHITYLHAISWTIRWICSWLVGINQWGKFKSVDSFFQGQHRMNSVAFYIKIYLVVVIFFLKVLSDLLLHPGSSLICISCVFSRDLLLRSHIILLLERLFTVLGRFHQNHQGLLVTIIENPT